MAGLLMSDYDSVEQSLSAAEEAMVEPPLPASRRFKKLGAAVLALGMVLGMAFTIRRSLGPKEFDWDDLSTPHPDFVNYDAVEVHTQFNNLTTHPRLCDAQKVAETCGMIHANVMEVFPNAYSAAHVHAADLSQLMSVSINTIKNLFSTLKLHNFDILNADAYQVSCQRLCEMLVASMPARHVPNRVDVGCYRDPDAFVFIGQHQPVTCNVDLGPDSLAEINMTQFNLNPRTAASHLGESSMMQALSPDSKTQDVIDSALNHAAAPSELQKAIIDRLTYDHENVEAVKHGLMGSFGIHPTISSGTQDATVLGFPAPGLPKVEAPNSRRLQAGTWKAGVLENAVLAQAFIDSALHKMAARQIAPVVLEWFGNNDDSPTRTEILRVLNSVRSMLGNVDYVYKGALCQPNMYAYVFQNEPNNKNKAGQFIFNLCDYYFQTNKNDQIATLTHEGSHHLKSGTGDEPSPIDGTTMYGQPKCKAVAAQCAQLGVQSDACSAARKNADTYCYFINAAQAYSVTAAAAAAATAAIQTPATPGVPAAPVAVAPAPVSAQPTGIEAVIPSLR